MRRELSHNRIYKARVFEMLFREKKEALELYNAVNGTRYEDEEQLEIVTLDNAIYMSMKNDVSFLIDNRLSVYEQQSTFNPNMPLRILLYVSDLYSVLTRDMNLYSTRLKQIPTPNFLIFYNGKDKQPESQILKLSDAYTNPEEKPELELSVRMLNINKGNNEKLMEACKTLADYVEYTNRVRIYAEEMDIEEAVERAVTECIREGILAEFLKRNRAEVVKMSIYEYDEEKHMQQEREEWEEIGWKKGLEKGEETGREAGEQRMSQLIQKLLAAGRTEELNRAASDKELRERLYEELGI